MMVEDMVKKKQGVTKKSYEIDMTSGPLLGKILLFALPLIASNIMQLLFNAADVIIVGRFVGNHALAAVGSTTALINLLTNLFIGLSIGTNVMIAKYSGGGNKKDIREIVHTSVLFSFLCGIALIFLGLFASGPLLKLMGTPEDVIDQATLYMQIYFAGMPVVMLYNFVTSILRAIGDTRRPLYYIMVAGIVNVLLNIFFITQFGMGVEGVALATVISQALSAFLVVRVLKHAEGAYKLEFKGLRINKLKLMQMVKIGLPAGMQGVIFSLSNTLIQSSINLFGSTAMAGSTAAANIEGFIYMAMNAFNQTALSFTAQNYGAGKFDRVKRVLLLCLACVTITGLGLGVLVYIFGYQLLGIYSQDATVMVYGMIRITYICLPYFMCGVMDVLAGSVRGLGYSVSPMISAIVGACGLRVLWIFTIFQMHKSLEILYLSYPVTWTMTSICNFVMFAVIYRRIKNRVKLQMEN